jgi:hypothetical protein
VHESQKCTKEAAGDAVGAAEEGKHHTLFATTRTCCAHTVFSDLLFINDENTAVAQNVHPCRQGRWRRRSRVYRADGMISIFSDIPHFLLTFKLRRTAFVDILMIILLSDNV